MGLDLLAVVLIGPWFLLGVSSVPQGLGWLPFGLAVWVLAWICLPVAVCAVLNFFSLLMLLEIGLVLAVLLASGVGWGRGRAKGIVIDESAGFGRGWSRGQATASAKDHDKGKSKSTPAGKGKNKRMPRSPTPS